MTNKPLSTQPYKGARDFYPEDKRVQKYMFSTLRMVAERFGYEEYDAPILEPTELYLSKGNQEIIDEQTYTFEDRGKRSVTIRTEPRASLSTALVQHPQPVAL
jgi:histidyl-tRNA synthetase